MNTDFLGAVIWAIIALLSVVLLIVLAFALGRAAGEGWYRAKFDNFKRVLHLTRGEADE
jgi:hypothetical protein